MSQEKLITLDNLGTFKDKLDVRVNKLVAFNDQNLADNPDVTLTSETAVKIASFDATVFDSLPSTFYFKAEIVERYNEINIIKNYKDGTPSVSGRFPLYSGGVNTFGIDNTDNNIASVDIEGFAGTYFNMMFCVNQNAVYTPYYLSNRQLTHEIHDLDFSVKADIADLREDTTVTTSTDSTPYLYRKSKAIGDRECLDYIDGGSLGWNQLVQNGNFSDTSGWTVRDGTFAVSDNVATLTAAAANYTQQLYQELSVTPNHKYLIRMSAKKTGNVTQMVAGLYNGTSEVSFKIFDISTSFNDFSFIVVPTSTVTNFRFGHRTNVTVGDVLSIKNINLIDLTLALGPTITDYVYSLEQVEAGSGIAWLKEQGLFTDKYYAYDPGSIKSVNVSGHKMTGFNQWNEEWELGALNGITGADYPSNNSIRSKGYIKVQPETTYYCKIPTGKVGIYYYDKDRTYKGYTSSVDGIANTTFTTVEGTEYIRLEMKSTYGSTYNHDICINISNAEKNGTYEPYEEHTYPITSTDLLGIPQLTSDNKLGFDGDRYNANGRVDRKDDIVDLGSLNWNRGSSGVFNANISTIKTNTNLIMCSKYATIDYSTAFTQMSDKTIKTDTQPYIYINDTDYTDTATFKTAMSGQYLVYEKATPTTENATPIINPQICSPYGTEEFISDSPVPVPHSTEYYKTPDWMDVEPFKSERKNNDSNTLKVDEKVDIATYNVTGSKNLLPMTLEGIKANNTSGTWSGNIYTISGGTVEVMMDSDNNVIGFKANGTFTATVWFNTTPNFTLNAGSYILNGAVDNIGFYGSGTTVFAGWDSTDSTPESQKTFTSDATGKIYLRLSAMQYNNVVAQPMIRLATDTDATFQPYAKTNLELTDDVRDIDYRLEGNACENLLGYSLTDLKALNDGGTWNNNVYTYKNISFTVNSDGTISITGGNTASGAIYFKLSNNVNIINETLWLSGCPSGGGYQRYRLYTENPQLFDDGSGKQINYSNTFSVIIVIYSGYTIPSGGLTFKPMISRNPNAEFEKHYPSNKELKVLKSVSFGGTTSSNGNINIPLVNCIPVVAKFNYLQTDYPTGLFYSISANEIGMHVVSAYSNNVIANTAVSGTLYYYEL